MKNTRSELILSFITAAFTLALFGVPLIIFLESMSSSFLQHYLDAWLILVAGILVCVYDPRIFVSDRTGMCAIYEVKIGFALLVLSVFVAAGLFAITGYRELNLPNYLTALSCVFGIFISFYFLYLVPRKVKKRRVLKELMNLRGIGRVYASRLYKCGILTEQNLVYACRTEIGIRLLSERTGVPAKVLEIATRTRLRPNVSRDVGAQ